jgi:hypothetical protein
MGVTLDQILMLTGRLDDASGFDSARERFRRFLLDHAREPAMARVLIDECRHAPGETHRRALQDLVVLLGRFMGFHARFASPLRTSAPEFCGEWQSPTLRVLVEARGDPPDATVLAALSHAVMAAPASPTEFHPPVVGLYVMTSLLAGRPVLDATTASSTSSSSSSGGGPVAVVSLGALLSMTALASAGRATHDDVVRLLTSSAPPGFILELLDRCVDDRALLGPAKGAGRILSTGFWILRVAAARGTTAEEFVEVVVGKRHVLGLAGDRATNDAVQPGDRICLSIAGKGVVGHGKVAALDASHPGIRDAHRFRHLWRLEDLSVYLAAPVPVDVETELRLRAASDPAHDGQTIVSISRESFDRMTSASDASAPEATDGASFLAG